MSLIKAIKAQLGLSNTATQNFTITAEAADGSMKLARGNAGVTTQDVMTVDAAGKVSFPQGFTGTPAAGSLIPFKTSVSALYTPANGETLSRPHGLGFVPTSCQLILECVVADNGYAVGERLVMTDYWNGTTVISNVPYADSTVCAVKVVAGYSGVITVKSTGAFANPTANAWKYYFVGVA